jgi:hypothetical protein
MRFEKASRKARPIYRIREVDGQDDDVADTLADLHRLTFFDGASIPEFDGGHWWLVFFEAMPVAFAGLVPSTRASNAGYFSRVGAAKTLWQPPSIAPDARDGSARKTQRMELCGIGYHRQPHLCEQLYPRRLSAVPAAISMGLAEYAVLAKIHHGFQTAPKARLRVTAF